MARSAGGGSRGGGRSHSSHSSHSSRGGGGGGGSRPSTRRHYGGYYRHRHCYVDRRGRRHTYYSDKPLNFSKTPEQFKRSEIRTCIIVTIFILFMPAFLTAMMIADSKTQSRKANGYKESYAVLEDKADVFTDSEERSLESALREFGRQTGAIPYVYTAKDMSIGSFKHTNIEDYAMEMYYKLFSDEYHYLVVYIDDEDWKWWAIQGDYTDPPISISDADKFGDKLQNELYSGKSRAKAFENAFDYFGPEAVKVRGENFKMLAPMWIVFLFMVLKSVLPAVAEVKKYTDEYNYYQQHGNPLPADRIYNRCNSCGAANPQLDDVCPYCGSSLIKPQ